jgi:hypothetical protein
MCVDNRGCNKLMVKKAYPVTRTVERMDMVTQVQFFLSLDLKSGYHQLPLHPNQVERMDFNTPLGKHKWIVLLMGLTNAPAVFQATMNGAFGMHKNGQ